MIRRLVALLLGVLLLGVGGTVLRFMLAAPRQWGLDVETLVIVVPAAFVLVGAALSALSVRGMLLDRRRRAMPLAPVRTPPAAAAGAPWHLADLASEIARRLGDSPCAVHHAGDRIEIRWSGAAWGRERCELRAVADGELEHADVIETPTALLRRRGGTVVRAGSSIRAGSGLAGAHQQLDTLERRAVHDALDEALALGGWRRSG